MIGSNSVGPPFWQASLKAMEPQILKASSEESTSWKLPSSSVTFTSTTWYPASTPESMAPWTPWSTQGMNSFGIAPPVTLSSNT